jgi:hypothetical protein
VRTFANFTELTSASCAGADAATARAIPTSTSETKRGVK